MKDFLKFGRFGEPTQGPQPFHWFTISTANYLSTASASNIDYLYCHFTKKKKSCDTVPESESIYLKTIQILHRQLLSVIIKHIFSDK